MLRNLLSINGIEKLNKKEQKQIAGGGSINGCWQQGRLCCFPSPGPFNCEPGICKGDKCLFF